MSKLGRRAGALRLYADVIDMCNSLGGVVRPCECVKMDGTPFEKDPAFEETGLSSSWDRYEFAIGIVENRPVFIGDVLHDKSGRYGQVIALASSSCHSLIVRTGEPCNRSFGASHLRWNPKPKTIFINGVELPAPVSIKEGIQYHLDLIGSGTYYWNTHAERDAVVGVINKALLGITA